MHHTQGLEQGGGAKHRKQSAQCNDDDHCLRQKQGGVVGAVASRMQGPLKGRSRRWVPQLVQSERGGSSKSLLLSLYKPPALC